MRNWSRSAVVVRVAMGEMEVTEELAATRALAAMEVMAEF